MKILGKLGGKNEDYKFYSIFAGLVLMRMMLKLPMEKYLSLAYRLGCSVALGICVLFFFLDLPARGALGACAVIVGLLGVLSWRVSIVPKRYIHTLEARKEALDAKVERLKMHERETQQTFQQIQVVQDYLEKSERAVRGRMEAINRTMCVCEIDLRGIVAEANAMMLQALQYTREEFVGRHFKHFIDAHFRESSLYELILVSLSNKIGYSGDVKLLGKREEVWLHLTLTPVFSGERLVRVILLGNDITIAKLKNIEYEASIKALQQFSPVAEFDLDGNFRRVNKLFSELLGYAGKQARLKNFWQVVIKTEEMQAIWRRIEAGNYAEGEFPVAVSDGRMVWLSSSFTPVFDLNDRLYKVVWIATDITERKDYEARVKDQTEDIMASIEYAQRIQAAMLPTREQMSEHLKDFFVLYMPKDIVSGDFYWFEVIEHKIFVIAVDCTGHGVPGAFMSMLGNENLHEIIGIREIHESNRIIEFLHQNIRKSLKQHENNNHEGMDIGVVIIDKQKQTLEFTGAKNNLWLAHAGKVQDVRGSWKGVGGYESDKPVTYETHHFPIESDTRFYLLSDGYIDQFGGAQGKKFGSKRFKALLESVLPVPLAAQGDIFRQTIEQWRKESNDKQIDDMMVLGVGKLCE